MWGLAKKALFRLDAETAHHLSVRAIRTLGGPALRLAAGEAPASPAQVFGMEFRSRVGLAAGFDKDAELIHALPDLGFGFAEIGTVVPRPQPGNDRPRLFRDPERQSLFNRMGFNSRGARVASENLSRARAGLPSNFRVGVNLGKNKDTPLEDAASDYAQAAEPFQGLADYLVINVSSPNTPGLRSLQTIEALTPIVEAVHNTVSRWSKAPPLLLKIAPEISGEELVRLLEQGGRWGLSGWVLCNTLGGTIEVGGEVGGNSLSGGWSGGAVTLHSRNSLLEARRVTQLPIVSVGGILTPDEAVERRRAGAELIQIYTGWIYNGPRFPGQLAKALI
jgi:dihydroorotate dehydrogenase